MNRNLRSHPRNPRDPRFFSFAFPHVLLQPSTLAPILSTDNLRSSIVNNQSSINPPTYHRSRARQKNLQHKKNSPMRVQPCYPTTSPKYRCGSMRVRSGSEAGQCGFYASQSGSNTGPSGFNPGSSQPFQIQSRPQVTLPNQIADFLFAPPPLQPLLKPGRIRSRAAIGSSRRVKLSALRRSASMREWTASGPTWRNWQTR
jgi:hypothetical protein